MSSFRPSSPSRSLHVTGKNSVSRSIARAALGLAILLALAPAAHATESLTYKGTLRDNDKAANGTYDLQVQLFSAEHGGTPITYPITLSQVTVKNGSFQVPVDLPGKLPADQSVWLQAQVKPPGSAAFQPLDGRQEIKSTLGGTCWETTGNSGVIGDVVGINDASSPLLRLKNNSSFLYLRGTGGLEQNASTAAAPNSAAFNGTSNAAGPNSFVAGRGQTGASHNYSTVFADGQGSAGTFFPSTAANQFLVRAQNGVGINTNAPRGSLSVQRGGVSGAGAINPSVFTAESDTNMYMTLLTPSSQERGILFGDEIDTAKGGIIFDAINPAGPNNDGLTFRTGGNVDRLRITSNGRMQLNGTGSGTLFVKAPPGATGPTLRLVHENDTFNNGTEMSTAFNGDFFLSTASGTMYLDSNLGIRRTSTANALEVEGNASKTTAGSWLANSDRRIKQDIAPIDDALALINRLEPVTFRYTDAYRGEHAKVADQRYYNVIAQDFAEVFPDAVKGSGEYLSGAAKTKDNEILQVDTYPATIAAIAAIQELDAKATAQDERVTTLDAKSSAQDERVAKLEAENAELRVRLTALELTGRAPVGKR